MAIKVLLVDDHEIVRRGLRELIESESDLEVCGEAGSLEEAEKVFAQCSPDVALLDVRLGEDSGVELCREFRSQDENVACLMLTSYQDDEALFAAIMAGASGYLLKEIRANDLLDAIRRVHNKESLIDPKVTEQVLAQIRHQHDQKDELSVLSPQERKILDLIAEGLTNRQIGERMYLAEKTVKNYVSNLLAKLGMSRRTEAAVLATRIADQKINHSS